MLRTFAALACLLCGTIATSAAAEVTFPLSGSLQVQLCIGGLCDSDISPVSGTVTMDVDLQADTVTLVSAEMILTETIDLLIADPFGSLTATGTNVNVNYANPGIPLGPFTRNPDGTFTLLDVPLNQAGMVAYTSTGTVCITLIAVGQPCDATFDLAEVGTVTATELPGSLVESDGELTLSLDVALVSPLDPDSPEFGTLTFTGTVSGTAALPGCPSDVDGTLCDTDIAPANGDCIINNQDLGTLLAAYLAQTGDGDFNAAADFNADGVINNQDLGQLLADYLNNCN